MVLGYSTFCGGGFCSRVALSFSHSVGAFLRCCKRVSKQNQYSKLGGSGEHRVFGGTLQHILDACYFTPKNRILNRLSQKVVGGFGVYSSLSRYSPICAIERFSSKAGEGEAQTKSSMPDVSPLVSDSSQVKQCTTCDEFSEIFGHMVTACRYCDRNPTAQHLRDRWVPKPVRAKKKRKRKEDSC